MNGIGDGVVAKLDGGCALIVDYSLLVIFYEKYS